MNAFTAVAKELWHFAIIDHFSTASDPVTPLVTKTLQLTSVPDVVTVPSQTVAETTVSAVIPGEPAYVAQAELPVHIFPTQMLDGVVACLPFGTELLVQQVKSQWVEVGCETGTGWVQAEGLVAKKAMVIPRFTADSVYDGASLQTQLLRAHIHDSFATTPEVSLQPMEYVTYILQTVGRTIVWPATRPRIAGTWQKILKGVMGIHIGIQPKTGSVMEVIDTDGTGQLWYVEAVFPDLAVRVSGVTEAGVYREQTIASKVWREWRPVFIVVS